MSIFAPVFKLDYIIKYNKYENGKSILDILGMSLFQTTLSDFLEGFKFRMQKGGGAEKSGRWRFL